MRCREVMRLMFFPFCMSSAISFFNLLCARQTYLISGEGKKRYLSRVFLIFCNPNNLRNAVGLGNGLTNKFSSSTRPLDRVTNTIFPKLSRKSRILLIRWLRSLRNVVTTYTILFLSFIDVIIRFKLSAIRYRVPINQLYSRLIISLSLCGLET